MEDLGIVGRLGRGTAVTWFAWVGGRLLTLATLILLTQTLSPRGLGALFSALATGVLGASLAMGGLPDATTRHAASASASPFGRGDVWRSLIRFAATLPLIAGLLLLIGYSSSGPLDVVLVVAGLLLAITQGATTIIASIFRAQGHAGRFAFVTTVFTSAGRTLVAIAVLALGTGADVVLWSFVGLNVVLIALTWQAAMRGLPPTSSTTHGDGAMQLGGVVWSLMGNLDVVVVGVLLGAGAAGMYGAALRLAEVTVQFLIALSVLYLPEATRLAVSHRTATLSSLYRTTCRWSTLVSLLAAGVGFIAAPALAAIVFPHDAATETALLRILFAGYAIHGALGQTYSTLLAIGAYGDILRSSLVSLPLIVVGTVALTYGFETVGAASATCAAYAATGIWWAVLVHRRIGASPFDRFYLRALLACVASFAFAVPAFELTSSVGHAVSVLATSAAALVVWLVLLPFSGGLSPGERVIVGQLRARLGRTSA